MTDRSEHFAEVSHRDLVKGQMFDLVKEFVSRRKVAGMEGLTRIKYNVIDQRGAVVAVNTTVMGDDDTVMVKTYDRENWWP